MNWENIVEEVKFNPESGKPNCPICGQDGESYAAGGQSCDCQWVWEEDEEGDRTGRLIATLNEAQQQQAAEEFYASFNS